MYKSNAEKQKAYRDRQRFKKATNITAIAICLFIFANIPVVRADTVIQSQRLESELKAGKFCDALRTVAQLHQSARSAGREEDVATLLYYDSRIRPLAEATPGCVVSEPLPDSDFVQKRIL